MAGVLDFKPGFKNNTLDDYTLYRKNLIYINLGMKCNFHCKYCFNRDHGDAELSAEMSPALKKYLVIDLPASLGAEQRLLQFWGGEPLLYFGRIKEIVALLRDIPNYRFFLTTNGSLLTPEIVDFLNENKVVCGISHDGPATLEYRSQDILEDEKIVHLIPQLQCFAGFSTVLTPSCSDVYRIHDYFLSKLPQSHAGFDLQTPYAADGSFVFTEQLDRDIQLFCSHAERNIALFGMNCLEFMLLRPYVGAYWLYQNNRNAFNNPLFKVFINLDLAGNLYLDHDCRWKIGNVESSLEELESNALTLYAQHVGDLETCKQCEVFSICHGGKVLPVRERDYALYCSTIKRLFLPILDFFKKGGM